MLFSELMDKYLDESIREDVLKLLKLKMNNPEITEGKRFDKVNEYLDRTILEVEEQIKDLPCSHEQSWEELNHLFISILKWELLYKGWFTLPTTLHRLTVHLWQK